MIGEVDAVRLALAPAARQVHWLRVQGTPVFPYYLLWQSTGRPLDEVPLCGSNDTVNAILGLTSVGKTAESAREVATAARRLLYPGGYPLELAVTGRQCEIQWSSFASAAEDRDVQLPGGGYPCTYVDLYRLTSIPA